VRPHLSEGGLLAHADPAPVTCSGGPFPEAQAKALCPEGHLPVQARRRQVSQTLRYVLVATTALAASLLVQIVWWHPEAPDGSPARTPEARTAEPPLAGYVATLTQSADCVWQDVREPLRTGSRLPAG